MSAVLVTGMSGVGKTTALRALAARGYETVETDELAWLVPEDGVGDAEWSWREDKIIELLDRPRRTHLFVSGTRENQGRLYDRFDAVVVLTAPTELIMERLSTRTDNPYGRSEADRVRVLADLREVEPLLIASADAVIDTAGPAAVVDELIMIADRAARP